MRPASPTSVACVPGPLLVRRHGPVRGAAAATLLLLLGAELACSAASAQGAAAPAQGTASTATPNAGMEFSDKPNYSVAGVTDWTAVGGHGSDSTLRTSEDLNREALALKARAAADATTNTSPADRERLAGDRAEAAGHPLLAVEAYQRAAQLEPSETNYLAWGTELLLHRAVWQATDVLAKAATALPKSAPIRTAWGAALFGGARYDEAAQQLCTASTLAPNAREPYLFAGKVAAAAPATDSCIGPMLERFRAENPRSAQASYFLAVYLRKQGGQAERVQQLLQQTVALDSHFSDAYVQLGTMAAARKDYTGAVADYKEALRADSGNSEAHYRLGVAYDRLGDHVAAQAEYATHSRLDGEHAAAVERERRDVQQFSLKETPAEP